MAHAKTATAGFSLHGEYRILAMTPKPKWFPLGLWLWMRRHGMLTWAIRSTSRARRNLVVLSANAGLGIVMQHLYGTTTYPLELTTAAIGTGNTAPADGDTALETPVVTGILRAVGELTDPATLYTEWFITNDELPNGEYKEFGLYAGTQLFTRALIESPTHTKADNEDTLIVYTVTASNA
jgi:hypothetical protein